MWMQNDGKRKPLERQCLLFAYVLDAVPTNVLLANFAKWTIAVVIVIVYCIRTFQKTIGGLVLLVPNQIYPGARDLTSYNRLVDKISPSVCCLR